MKNRNLSLQSFLLKGLAITSVLATLTIHSAKALTLNTALRQVNNQSLSTNLIQKESSKPLLSKHRELWIVVPNNSYITLAQISPLAGIAIILLLAGGIGAGVFLLIIGFIQIEQDEVGIVRKRIGRPTSYLIAFDPKESGWQATMLDPGFHWRFPWLYEIYKEKAISIGLDEIGIVEAKDGAPLESGQNFGEVVKCNNFQDAQRFFTQGGQRGKQLATLNHGIWRINTKLFTVKITNRVHIHTNQVGLVEAKDGAPLEPGQNFGRVAECNNFQDAQKFLNNDGQRGKQLAILTTGIWQINTELFSVHKVPIVRILPGEIGLVIAQDGHPLSDGRILGKIVKCNNFQNAELFIKNGGERGKQLAILRASEYQINTDLFTVITTANATQHGMDPEDLKIYTVNKNRIGIVTTLDGKPLPKEEIAGPLVEGHDKFQNGQNFIDAGGYRGLQEDFLNEGAWSLNPWFAQIQQISLTEIFADQVGVIISYVGKKIDSISEGRTQLVNEGYKGICKKPLPPGRYALNSRVKNIEIVPTNSIVLEWSDEQKSADNYDVNLKTLRLRSQDAFEFKITVTQVICIAAEDAPKMVLRAGAHVSKNVIDDNNDSPMRKKNNAIKNLVARILGPMIDNYFQDAAQGFEALDFLAKRSQIQAAAAEHIEIALNEAGVQALGTFINIIDFPDVLEKQLKDREVLRQERQTYAQKTSNEVLLQELIREQAVTRSQADMVDVQKKLEMAQIHSQMFVEEATGKARAKEILDGADLKRQQGQLDIDAQHQQQISQIEINKFKETVRSLSPDIYARLESDKAWSQALAQLKIDMPEVFIGGSSGNSPGTDVIQASTMQFAWMDMLMDMLKQREPKPINPPSVELLNSDPESN